ncbi:MAG: CAP domain-containing protein [Oryzihumus sp.]
MALLLTTLLTTLLTSLLLAGAPAADAAVWRVPAPRHTDPQRHLTEFENRVVYRIDRVRAAAGLPQVRWFGSCVDGYAERWDRRLAASGAFRHRDQHEVLRGCGFTWAGEALVRGTGITPRDVVRAWMHSPEHRAVLMKPRANRAGIGITRDAHGRIVGVLNLGDVS